jgi:hypothetical protein
MKYLKMFEEFVITGSQTADPVVAPPATPTTTPRPWRPVPTQVPRPGTEEKPMGTFKDVMDIFFAELDKVKDTPEGKEIIQKLQSKYGIL